MAEGMLRLRTYVEHRDVRKYNRLAREMMGHQKSPPKETAQEANTSGSMRTSPTKRRPGQYPDKLMGDAMEAETNEWLRVSDPNKVTENWEKLVTAKLDRWARQKKAIFNRAQRDLGKLSMVVEAMMSAS